ncbi:hypothetical protein BDZ45DRAFT_698672 [Acephala macrosclerotiorum]|nr:hypothetical protein BDZ45DRAFT_698672 [Acephala macrosclerotiorum]
MDVSILERAQLILLGLACDLWNLSRLLSSFKPCGEDPDTTSTCVMKLGAISSSLMCLHKTAQAKMYPLDVLDCEELEEAQNYWSAVLDIAETCSLLNPVHMSCCPVEDNNDCRKAKRVYKSRDNKRIVDSVPNGNCKPTQQPLKIPTGPYTEPSTGFAIYEIVCELENLITRILCTHHGIPELFRVSQLSQLGGSLPEPEISNALGSKKWGIPFKEISSIMDRLSPSCTTTLPSFNVAPVPNWSLHVVALAALQVGVSNASLGASTLEAPDFRHFRTRSLHSPLNGLGISCRPVDTILPNRIARTTVVLRAARKRLWSISGHLYGKQFLVEWVLVSMDGGRRKMRNIHLFDESLVISRPKSDTPSKVPIAVQHIPADKWKSVMIRPAGYIYQNRNIETGQFGSAGYPYKDVLLLFWSQESSEGANLAVVEFYFNDQTTLLIWAGFLAMLLPESRIPRLAPSKWVSGPFLGSYREYLSARVPPSVDVASKHMFPCYQY